MSSKGGQSLRRSRFLTSTWVNFKQRIFFQFQMHFNVFGKSLVFSPLKTRIKLLIQVSSKWFGQSFLQYPAKSSWWRMVKQEIVTTLFIESLDMVRHWSQILAVQELGVSVFAFLWILTKSRFLPVTGEAGVPCRYDFCQEAVASSGKSTEALHYGEWRDQEVSRHVET